MRQWSRFDYIGCVVLLKRMKERDCYALLRDECGFTHYGVRVVAHRYMWSERWKRALEKEKKAFKEMMAEDIEVIALQCMRDDPVMAGNALLSLVWRKRNEPPAICWETTLEAIKRIGLVMEFDKQQKQTLRQTVDIIRRYERKVMLERWTENLLTAYLTIKGYLPSP